MRNERDQDQQGQTDVWVGDKLYESDRQVKQNEGSNFPFVHGPNYVIVNEK